MALNRKQIRALNRKMDTVALLRNLGYDIYRLPMTLKCPFHDDTSKSAKVFEDGHIYCWTEQKMFGAYDVLKLSGVTDNQMLRLLTQIGATDEQEVSALIPDLAASKDLRILYRLGKVQFMEYVERIFVLYGQAKG